MGKPKKRDKYVSKGIVGQPAKTGRTKQEKIMDAVNRWYAEKPVKIKVPSETNKHIMEKVWATDAWGHPRPKYKVAVEDEGK